MLAHKFIGGSIAGGQNLCKKTDQSKRARTRQAADPNSITVQNAKTDKRKYSYGVQWRLGTDWTRAQRTVLK